MINDKLQKLKDNKLFEQLEAAYGKDKAEEISLKIYRLKQGNPNKIFSFVFDEHGNFQASEKKLVIL